MPASAEASERTIRHREEMAALEKLEETRREERGGEGRRTELTGLRGKEKPIEAPWQL